MSRSGILVALIIALGAASSPALAKDTDRLQGSYGGATQTWADIERAREDIQRQIAAEYHLAKPDAVAPGTKHKPLRHRDP